jgi:hypothetical protein
MTVEISLDSLHPVRPYVTRSHMSTGPLVISITTPDRASGWIVHTVSETNVLESTDYVCGHGYPVIREKLDWD